MAKTRIPRPPAVWCGSQLRDVRKSQGLTQYELAERMDPSRPLSLRTCISRWESDVHPPTGSSLFALCAALGVEPQAFYEPE